MEPSRSLVPVDAHNKSLDKSFPPHKTFRVWPYQGPKPDEVVWIEFYIHFEYYFAVKPMPVWKHMLIRELIQLLKYLTGSIFVFSNGLEAETTIKEDGTVYCNYEPSMSISDYLYKDPLFRRGGYTRDHPLRIDVIPLREMILHPTNYPSQYQVIVLYADQRLRRAQLMTVRHVVPLGVFVYHMSTGQNLAMYTYSVSGANGGEYMVDTNRTLLEVVEFTGASEVDGILEISSRLFIPVLSSHGSCDATIGQQHFDDIPRQVPIGVGLVMFHLRLQVMDDALGSEIWSHRERMNVPFQLDDKMIELVKYVGLRYNLASILFRAERRVPTQFSARELGFTQRDTDYAIDVYPDPDYYREAGVTVGPDIAVPPLPDAAPPPVDATPPQPDSNPPLPDAAV